MSFGNDNQSFKHSHLRLFNVSNDKLFFETLNASGTCQKRVELLKIMREFKRSLVVLTPL